MEGKVYTTNGQFQITFENGFTVSVGNDWTHYCSNRQPPTGKAPRSEPRTTATVEMACLGPDDGFRRDIPGFAKDFAHDDVIGYTTPAELLKFMNAVAKMRR